MRLLPGVALNFSKKGASLSLGGAPFTMNVGPRGVYTTASIPGTGLSMRKKLSFEKKAPQLQVMSQMVPATPAVPEVAVIQPDPGYQATNPFSRKKSPSIGRMLGWMVILTSIGMAVWVIATHYDKQAATASTPALEEITPEQVKAMDAKIKRIVKDGLGAENQYKSTIKRMNSVVDQLPCTTGIVPDNLGALSNSIDQITAKNEQITAKVQADAKALNAIGKDPYQSRIVSKAESSDPQLLQLLIKTVAQADELSVKGSAAADRADKCKTMMQAMVNGNAE